jgi:phage replication-related protein YjqB (UPF0714/DUF867 family)
MFEERIFRQTWCADGLDCFLKSKIHNIMSSYRSYRELLEDEAEGEDFRIHWRRGRSGILVMAPHGGGIEPGTTEIADAVAGTDHSFYSFEGIKIRGNAILHVRSGNFDEPIGVRLAAESETVVTIHGCRGMEEHVYIGGRHTHQKEIVREKLLTASFAVLESTRFPGLSRGNICNRCRGGRGVQLEISAGMRRSLFQDISRLRRKEVTAAFDRLVATLRDALGGLSAARDESR